MLIPRSLSSAEPCNIFVVSTLAANPPVASPELTYSALCGGKRFQGRSAQGTPEHPLVTVVTAVFNGQPYTAGCLESVLGQDYPNIEHLVLDAGSRDGTIDVLRAYSDRVEYWKSEPDKGLYDAWNKALLEARGEWICFLGVDDELLPGAITAYMDLARKNPEAEFMSSLIRWTHKCGYMRVCGQPWKWRNFIRWCCISHVASMHRRSLFDRLGNYDISYGSAADYEFLLRTRGSLKAAFMPVETAMMRAGGYSDGSTAFVDATRAKIRAGGRNPLLAYIELAMAKVRHPMRPLRRAAGRLLARLKR